MAKSKQDGPAIICLAHPTNSLGETVYKNQAPDEKDQPIVAGKFVLPSAINLVQPTLPKSFHLNKPEKVNVEGVVARNGSFIDGKAVGAATPQIAQSALDSVIRSTFKPGTLDGKPVAVFIQVTIQVRPPSAVP